MLPLPRDSVPSGVLNLGLRSLSILCSRQGSLRLSQERSVVANKSVQLARDAIGLLRRIHGPTLSTLLG